MKKNLKNENASEEVRVGDTTYSRLREYKNAVANISKVNYYNANKSARVKCDANHNELNSTIEQQTDSKIFRFLMPKHKRKKYSTNELELSRWLFGQLTGTKFTY